MTLPSGRWASVTRQGFIEVVHLRKVVFAADVLLYETKVGADGARYLPGAPSLALKFDHSSGARARLGQPHPASYDRSRAVTTS
jgi:hypothetical protein